MHEDVSLCWTRELREDLWRGGVAANAVLKSILDGGEWPASDFDPQRNIPGLESLNWRLGRIQVRSERSEESRVLIPDRYPTQTIPPVIWATETLEWIFFLLANTEYLIQRIREQTVIEKTWRETVLAYFNFLSINSLGETEEVYEILDNNRAQSLASYPGPTKQERKSANKRTGAFSMVLPIWTAVSQLTLLCFTSGHVAN
jgi:hypothetical protein